jgi:hypothetical protein
VVVVMWWWCMMWYLAGVESVSEVEGDQTGPALSLQRVG